MCHLNRNELLRFEGDKRAAAISALTDYVRYFENRGVCNLVLSAKCSSVADTVFINREVAKLRYPLHVGVTEAGTLASGTVKSSIGIGSLLLKGIGDTIRVSLTADPREEIIAAKRILRSVGLDENYVEVISCPTCGRTEYDSISLANKVESLTSGIKKRLKIAVMGCVVNGPGEAADCDLGIAGGSGYCAFFKNGKVYKKVAFEKAEEEFLKEINQLV